MTEDNRDWPTFEYARRHIPSEIAEAKTVKELLGIAARLWPYRLYLIYAPSDVKVSYSEFVAGVKRVAQVFDDLGIGKDCRVALFLRNSPEYLYCIYACAYLGAIQVPINHFYQEQEVEQLLHNSQATAVVTETDLLPVVQAVRNRIPSLKHVLLARGQPPSNTQSLEELTLSTSEFVGTTTVRAEDLCAIIYTTRATTPPRGCVLTNNSYVIPAKAAGLLPIQPGDADYTCLPLFHINAQIYSALGMMTVGGTLVLSDRFSPTKFWHELFTYKPKFFNSLGSITQILYSLPPTAKDTIQPARYVIANGTPKQLWVKFEQRFNLTIIEGYSQTEDPLPFLNYPAKSRKPVGSLGVPIFQDLGHEIKVIDEDGGEAPPDIRGELVRKSPCTMVGYWNDPALTRMTIRDGWLHTGDIVLRNAEGFVTFVENKHFLVRRADESIAPWEVESTVKDLPKVEDCAVIPVPDTVKGQEIKALVKLRSGQTEGTCPQREIVSWTAQRLAYFKVPRYIEYVNALPYMPTGRIDKAKLYEEHRRKQAHGWDRDKEMPDWRAQQYKST